MLINRLIRSLSSPPAMRFIFLITQLIRFWINSISQILDLLFNYYKFKFFQGYYKFIYIVINFKTHKIS
jgi:hypothetical protein